MKFVWDTPIDTYLTEIDGLNAIQVAYTNEPVQFGRLITQRRSSTTNWYHTDALGSTSALTDSNQATLDTYIYDGWGNFVSVSGTTVNPFRWNGIVGYYLDIETDHYYIRARTFNPVVANWTSIDPLIILKFWFGSIESSESLSSDLGLYAYVANRPIMIQDPSGFGPCDIPDNVPLSEEGFKIYLGKIDGKLARKIRDCLKREFPKFWRFWVKGEKYLDLRNKGKQRRGGKCKLDLLKYFFLIECEAGCVYSYSLCLDLASVAFLDCLEGTYEYGPENRPEATRLCGTIYNLDITTCPTLYAACGLACLLPVSVPITD